MFTINPEYSDAGQRVLELAREDARSRGSRDVGVESLMVGVLRHGGNAVIRALESLGVSPSAVAEEIDDMRGWGKRYEGELSSTPSTKKALGHALHVSIEFGQDKIGPELIFLGTLKEGEGIGCIVLQHHVYDLGIIYLRVLTTLADEADPEGSEPLGAVFNSAAINIQLPRTVEEEKQLYPIIEELFIRLGKRTGVICV